MKELAYSHILNFVQTTPWAILPGKFAAIMDILVYRAGGGMLTDEEIRQRIGAAARPAQRQTGMIAVLPLFGTIIPRGNMMMESSGATSVERFTQQFRQMLADSAVGGIILDVNSPGGSVNGVDELAAEIYRARGVKPMLAVANHMAASAAYYIASSAEEMMATPTSEVGSIGVFAAHYDESAAYEKEGIRATLISAGKYKIEGNPFEPLTDEARTAIQERVNDYYNMFVSAVARNRKVDEDKVRKGFGEGRMVGAREAKRLGMIDAIGTMDDAIERMTKRLRDYDRGSATRGDSNSVNITITYGIVDDIQTFSTSAMTAEEIARIAAQDSSVRGSDEEIVRALAMPAVEMVRESTAITPEEAEFVDIRPIELSEGQREMLEANEKAMAAIDKALEALDLQYRRLKLEGK